MVLIIRKTLNVRYGNNRDYETACEAAEVRKFMMSTARNEPWRRRLRHSHPGHYVGHYVGHYLRAGHLFSGTIGGTRSWK